MLQTALALVSHAQFNTYVLSVLHAFRHGRAGLLGSLFVGWRRILPWPTPSTPASTVLPPEAKTISWLMPNKPISPSAPSAPRADAHLTELGPSLLDALYQDQLEMGRGDE